MADRFRERDISIMNDLVEGKLNKKEIARKYHVDMGVVIKIDNVRKSKLPPQDAQAVATQEQQEPDLPPLDIFGKEFSLVDNTYMALFACLQGKAKKWVQKKYSLKAVEAQRVAQAANIINKAYTQMSFNRFAYIDRGNAIIDEILRELLGRSFFMDCVRVQILQKQDHEGNEYYEFRQIDADGQIVSHDTQKVVMLDEVSAILEEDEDQTDTESSSTTLDKHHVGRVSKFNDDECEEIYSTYSEGKHTYASLALAYNASVSSIQRAVKRGKSIVEQKMADEHILNGETVVDEHEEVEVDDDNSISDFVASESPNIEEENTEEEIEETEYEEEEDIEPLPDRTPIGNSNMLNVGLVSDRHEMPVEMSIFEGPTMESTFVYDYDRLELHVNRFIDDHIQFDEDGNAKQMVCLYCTGIQAPLAAVIKVCHARRVNLILKHHYGEYNKYPAQVIWDEFGNVGTGIPNQIATLVTNVKFANTYKCDVTALSKISKIYKVAVINYKQKTTFVDYTEIDLTDTMDKAWECYMDRVKQFPHYSHNVAIFMDELTTRIKPFDTSKQIMSSKNFK